MRVFDAGTVGKRFLSSAEPFALRISGSAGFDSSAGLATASPRSILVSVRDHLRGGLREGHRNVALHEQVDRFDFALRIVASKRETVRAAATGVSRLSKPNVTRVWFLSVTSRQ